MHYVARSSVGLCGRYDTYDEVMGVLPKLPRPVLITFTRALKEDRPASTFAPAARPSSMADQQQQQQVTYTRYTSMG